MDTTCWLWPLWGKQAEGLRSRRSFGSGARCDVIEWQRQNKRSELCDSASSQFGLTVTMASLKERMAAKRGGSNATEVHVPGIAHDLPSARVHDAPN